MARGRPRKTTTVEPEVTEELTQPEVTEPIQPVTASDESLIDSGKPSLDVVPATFEMSGRFLVCAVCGTRASKDINQNLFCSNLHNHPLLEETSDGQ